MLTAAFRSDFLNIVYPESGTNLVWEWEGVPTTYFWELSSDSWASRENRWWNESEANELQWIVLEPWLWSVRLTVSDWVDTDVVTRIDYITSTLTTQLTASFTTQHLEYNTYGLTNTSLNYSTIKWFFSWDGINWNEFQNQETFDFDFTWYWDVWSVVYLKLSAFDEFWASSDYIDDVQLQDAPLVINAISLTWTVEPVQVWADVQFYVSQMSGTISTVLWDFWDWTTSFDQQPQKIYSTPGTYTVTVTMWNSLWDTTFVATDFITIVPFDETPLLANFSVTPPRECEEWTIVEFNWTWEGSPTKLLREFFTDWWNTDFRAFEEYSKIMTANFPVWVYSVKLTAYWLNDQQSSTDLFVDYLKVNAYPRTAPELDFTITNVSWNSYLLETDFEDIVSLDFSSSTDWWQTWNSFWAMNNETWDLSWIWLWAEVSLKLTVQSSFDVYEKEYINALTIVELAPQISNIIAYRPEALTWESIEFFASFWISTPPFEFTTLWDFWDWTTSTEYSPMKVYEVPGVYSPTVTITSSAWTDTFTRTNYIIITSSTISPIAEFEAFPLELKMAYNDEWTFDLYDLSENEPTSWLWEVAWIEATDQNISLIFWPFEKEMIGIYDLDVSLTVSNSAWEDVMEKVWYLRLIITDVVPKPVVEFHAETLEWVAPFVTQFYDDTVNNPTRWLRDFGLWFTSTFQNAEVTYYIPGTYTVTLTAWNAEWNATLTKQAYINVTAAPGQENLANIEQANRWDRTRPPKVESQTRDIKQEFWNKWENTPETKYI